MVWRIASRELARRAWAYNRLGDGCIWMGLAPIGWFQTQFFCNWQTLVCSLINWFLCCVPLPFYLWIAFVRVLSWNCCGVWSTRVVGEHVDKFLVQEGRAALYFPSVMRLVSIVHFVRTVKIEILASTVLVFEAPKQCSVCSSSFEMPIIPFWVAEARTTQTLHILAVLIILQCAISTIQSWRYPLFHVPPYHAHVFKSRQCCLIRRLGSCVYCHLDLLAAVDDVLWLCSHQYFHTLLDCKSRIVREHDCTVPRRMTTYYSRVRFSYDILPPQLIQSDVVVIEQSIT